MHAFVVAMDCGNAMLTQCVNTELAAANAAGVVLVAASSNMGHLSTTCNLEYPEWRPEVVTVNGTMGKGPLDERSAAKGGVPAWVRGSLSVKLAGIGLTAPFNHTGTYGMTFDGTSMYGGQVSFGSSFAAPVVTGATALVRDAFRSNGWSGDADRIKAALFMMGSASAPFKPS